LVTSSPPRDTACPKPVHEETLDVEHLHPPK
jgi:hypothetical protein